LTNSSPTGKKQTKKNAPPRWQTKVAPADVKRSRGNDIIDFSEALCRITKDSIAGSAGELIKFRDWQKKLTRDLFAVGANGKLKHRTALIGLPRKNGKSAWLASIALEHLVFSAGGSEVYSCAADRDQAKIVFNTVKEMVRLEPELEFLQTYRDTIYNPKNGTVYKALSSESFTKEGLSGTLVCFDEVHAQPNRELWDVMALSQGARTEPLMIGITTAGVKTDSSGKDSLCYGLYEYGKKVASGEVDDPTFFFSWWEASDPAADFRSPATWREANPGFDDIVSAADFESVINRTPESEFRTKRLNQWVSTSDTWLPAGSWDNCIDQREVPDGTAIVLGFDGSFNGDCTAIVGVTCEENPHVFIVEMWEKPDGESADWQVPVMDVEESIRNACLKWQVEEIACDAYRWARTFQILDDEGLPVVLFPQNASRMTPATTRFYEAVMNSKLTHDGDPRLERHVSNATLKTDQRGSRLAKETRNSTRRIDLAVASVMALERAAWWATQGNGMPMIFDPWALEEFDA
jgi:phage terminase large subunit-like protein